MSCSLAGSSEPASLASTAPTTPNIGADKDNYFAILQAQLNSLQCHFNSLSTPTTATQQSSGTQQPSTDANFLKAFLDQQQLATQQLTQGVATMNKFAGVLELNSTVTQEQAASGDPEYQDRVIAKEHAFTICETKKFDPPGWPEALFLAAAIPHAIKVADVPFGTISTACSNVKSFMDVEAKSHASFWWDTAVDFGSKLSDWTSSAVSEASKAVSSAHDCSMLTNAGLVLGGTAAATGLAYGAYGAYKYFTGPAARKDEKDEDGRSRSSTVFASAKGCVQESAAKFGLHLETAQSGVGSVLNSLASCKLLALPGKP